MKTTITSFPSASQPPFDCALTVEIVLTKIARPYQAGALSPTGRHTLLNISFSGPAATALGSDSFRGMRFLPRSCPHIHRSGGVLP